MPALSTSIDYLAALLHGRRSRLAEGERLDELCRIRTTGELGRTLFPGSNLESSAALQRRFLLDFDTELSGLARGLGGAGAEFLSAQRHRLFAENLKVLARGFVNRLPFESLTPHLLDLPAPRLMDYRALAAADSIGAFASRIPEPDLRDAVLSIVPLYRKRPTPFFVEAALDGAALARQRAPVERFPAGDRDAARPVIRQEADLHHLMLALRGRFHHGLKPEELEPLFGGGGQLSPARWIRMLSASDPRGAAAPAAGLVFDPVPGGADIPEIEKLAWTRYLRLANRAFRRAPVGLGALAGFVGVRRIERANLVRLAEGLRAGLQPEALRGLMIPGPRREAAHA